jgi:hypothetical protein
VHEQTSEPDGAAPTAAEPTAEARPLLRIVQGSPDDAELAALTAVVLAVAARSTTPPPAQPARSLWANRADLVRRPLHPGPGAWRAAGLPR